MNHDNDQSESEALRAGAEAERAADESDSYSGKHSTHTIEDESTDRRSDVGPLTTDAEAQDPDSIVDPTAS